MFAYMQTVLYICMCKSLINNNITHIINTMKTTELKVQMTAEYEAAKSEIEKIYRDQMNTFKNFPITKDSPDIEIEIVNEKFNELGAERLRLTNIQYGYESILNGLETLIQYSK